MPGRIILKFVSMINRNVYIIAFFVLTVFHNSCTRMDSACELSKADKEWILSDVDSLPYLKNGIETISMSVETIWGQSSYDYSLGIRHGDNNHWATSTIVFNLSEGNKTQIKFHVRACWNTVTFIHGDFINDVPDVSFVNSVFKDSVRSEIINVIGVEYVGYVKFTRPQESLVKEFYFVKNNGIVKLVTADDDVYELLP
jgi:hypothetical protein